VTGSALRVLGQARETEPEEFAGSEDALVDAARTLPVRELRAVLEHWRQAVSSMLPQEREERLYERRRLYASPTLNGMVRVDGDLDPEIGGAFMAALQAQVDADVRREHDLRSPAQCRADALGEICRQWLDRSDRPEVAGERPHLSVNLDLEVLEERTGTASLDQTASITGESARRIACDAQITRVVTRGRSEVLDVGRKTPVVSAAIRKALITRDGGCSFPTCDRPHSWCDAHHIVHWADGGKTKLDNLVLLCRPHHRMTHQGFRVQMTVGRATFFRPNGTSIEDRAPP